jgi:hypothetical protein
MNIKKYASHSKFKGFGCEIVNNRYPQTYSPDGYDILTTQTIESSIKQLNNYANEI